MKPILIILSGLMIQACAFGADGQILINQATVMAAGGFPYTISQPGSYKLSGNLIDTALGNGIVITASNVTLDLNGFAIVSTANNILDTSAPKPNAYAITTPSNGPSNGASVVTIRNGMIRGNWFPIGADFQDLDSWTLEDLFLLPAGFNETFLMLGSFCKVINVTAPVQDILVVCPSVVTGSAAHSVLSTDGIFTKSAGVCSFFNNAVVRP